jgi:hypothetical protein
VSPSPPDGDGGEPGQSGRGNLFGLIAVVVLVALGYWAFHFIDHQRKMQDCLDSGRRNCAERVNGG